MANNLLICACGESFFEGLPCRHELAVYIKASRPLNQLYINKRWRYSYFNPQDIDPIPIDDDETQEASQPNSMAEVQVDTQIQSISSQEDSQNISSMRVFSIVILLFVNFRLRIHHVLKP